MPIGGTHVVVVMMTGMAVVVIVIVTVIVIVLAVMVVRARRAAGMVVVAQQPDARQIHRETDDGDGDGLGEMDGDGRKQPQGGLIADGQRDHAKDDGAGEAREVAELAGAEGKAGIVGMPPGKAIGECGDGQRASVGRHLPAVRQQGHRANTVPPTVSATIIAAVTKTTTQVRRSLRS